MKTKFIAILALCLLFSCAEGPYEPDVDKVPSMSLTYTDEKIQTEVGGALCDLWIAASRAYDLDETITVGDTSASVATVLFTALYEVYKEDFCQCIYYDAHRGRITGGDIQDDVVKIECFIRKEIDNSKISVSAQFYVKTKNVGIL